VANNPDLPSRGTRITTPDGDWEVQEVMLLGREPLHFAVRVACPIVSGSRLSIVLSRTEYEALLARSRAPPEAAVRGSRPGKLDRR
jgi:hypothetical protein